MAYTVFFSWQNDTPPEWGRNFIERALTDAKNKLTEELNVEAALRSAEFVVDRDTKGTAGTPPIVETIFKKIDTACAFVADLTFVGKRLDGRPTPNPNVLLEYGWALRSRGYSRIIVLMNTAYGEPNDETLPFNMKHLRRPITYCLRDGADDATKRKARTELAATLKAALQAIVESPEFQELIPKPPEVPRFVEIPPVDGPARFQKRDKPIGVLEVPFGMSGARDIVLADGPCMWLRVMPDEEQAREWTVAELRATINTGGRLLLPLGNFGSSWSYIRSADGFGYMPTMHNDSHVAPAVILAFKSGEVWSVYCGPYAAKEQLFNIEPTFVECFMRCIAFLRDGLSISLPYRWIAGIEGMTGKRLQKVAQAGHYYPDPFTGPCLEDTVTESGVLSEGDKVPLGLSLFFRKLYDACGAERPVHMDTILLQQFPDGSR